MTLVPRTIEDPYPEEKNAQTGMCQDNQCTGRVAEEQLGDLLEDKELDATGKGTMSGLLE